GATSRQTLAGRHAGSRPPGDVGRRAWDRSRRARALWRGVAQSLLKEILPDPVRRDAEPVVGVFPGLLHGERLTRRHDAIKLALLGRRELGEIGLGEI